MYFQIGIQVSIFHGGKSLCEPQKISEKTIEDKTQFEIYETLEFNIEVCNVPKNAKLCFVVYEVSRNSKSNKTKKSKESVSKVCTNFLKFLCFFVIYRLIL